MVLRLVLVRVYKRDLTSRLLVFLRDIHAASWGDGSRIIRSSRAGQYRCLYSRRTVVVYIIQYGSEERCIAAWPTVLVMCNFVWGWDSVRDGVEAVGEIVARLRRISKTPFSGI